MLNKFVKEKDELNTIHLDSTCYVEYNHNTSEYRLCTEGNLITINSKTIAETPANRAY